jgi:hypothetical protein
VIEYYNKNKNIGILKLKKMDRGNNILFLLSLIN